MADNGRITIMIDGSGTGYSAAFFSENEVYYTHQEGATNNDAEYNGAILALEHLPDGAKALVLSDSELVVNQINGKYQCNLPRLNEKRRRVQSLINNKNLDVKFEWMPREKNRADLAIRQYINPDYLKLDAPSNAGGPDSSREKIQLLEARD